MTTMEILSGGGFHPPYILDILCVLTFLFLSLAGAKKGGIKCVLGFISTLAALVCALVFAKEVAAFLNDTFSVSDALGGRIEKLLLKIKGFNVDLSAVGMEKALQEVRLPSFIKDLLIEQFGDETLAEGTTLAAKAGGAIAGLIVKLCAGILIFIGVKILLSLLAKILTGVTEKIAVASAINTLLGALLGVFKAFVIVCGILAIVSVIPSESLVASFNETYLVRYLYNDNPLMKLIAA